MRRLRGSKASRHLAARETRSKRGHCLAHCSHWLLRLVDNSSHAELLRRRRIPEWRVRDQCFGVPGTVLVEGPVHCKYSYSQSPGRASVLQPGAGTTPAGCARSGSSTSASRNISISRRRPAGVRLLPEDRIRPPLQADAAEALAKASEGRPAQAARLTPVPPRRKRRFAVFTCADLCHLERQPIGREHPARIRVLDTTSSRK